VDPDLMNNIENVRDFSMILSAFDKNAQGAGLAITPARTTMPFPAINLRDYAQPGAHLLRLLGSLTLSYAQGKTDVSGTSYTRTAYAISTSAYWRADDDPVVAVAKATKCTEAAFDKISDRPTITAADAQRLVDLTVKARAGDKAAQDELAKWDRRDGRIDAEQEKAALDAYNACAQEVLDEQGKKWNRSRYAVSFAGGSVKPTDGGNSHNLGRVLAFSVLYGFDGIRALEDRAAVSLTVRRAQGEPVLATLGTASISSRNSSVAALRLSGGSSVFRGLIEASNAKSTAGDATFTERTFKRALGIDYRVAKGVWLNLRYGKQRKVDGTGDETGSLLLLNWSPSALLGH
ncbi:MAG TPA: hypothetical protein VJ608_06480, partial [Albitalea sp.]|nr:hypothetical protein [Albitalea sp.]